MVLKRGLIFDRNARAKGLVKADFYKPKPKKRSPSIWDQLKIKRL